MPSELTVEPLPEAIRSLLEGLDSTRLHPGLLLDKFLKPCPKQEQQRDAIGRVCTAGKFVKELQDEWLPRRAHVLEVKGATVWTRRTRGPLTLHLARASSMENAGICLHPVYGFAFLPGTGLKGMARAFAETVWKHAQNDKEEAKNKIEEVFGRTATKADGSSSSGTVVFHDAWPTGWPDLVSDIVNNHHKQYYQGEGAPVDWDDPNPVYLFCLAPDQAFSFALSPRKKDVPKEHTGLARAWLDGALSYLGAGAKTASGYGYFQPQAEEQQAAALTPARGEARATVELVTPAFLAGADQGKADCELRPATLKGLLRWWWRTLYAGFLDKNQLAALEGAIWGDTVAAGAVQVLVQPEQVKGPKLYDYKDGFKPKPEFAQEHCLEPPPAKSTPGVLYLSYGMDDGGKKRYYLEPGSSWTIRLIARKTKFHSDREALRDSRLDGKEVSRDKVLEQAMAALWLLCRFGGVGAKSRNGFGSLQITGPEIWHGMRLDELKEASIRLLGELGLPDGFTESRAESSAMGNVIGPVEKDTVWTDPWRAMDQVGLAYQVFTKRYKHRQEKLALGLPRKIHGPFRDRVLRGKDRANHRPPEELARKINKTRFASPVHIHVYNCGEGKLGIRVVAFPAPHLPELQKSTRFLKEFCETFRVELETRASQKGQPPAAESLRASRGITSFGPTKKRTEDPGREARKRAGVPSSGDMVEAVLLEEKTKKGGWKARHESTGFQGEIVNTADVPGDKKAGDTVALEVHSVTERRKKISFRWKA